MTLRKRTLAAVIAFMMVITAAICTVGGTEYSSADPVDYDHYYYDQLPNDLSKDIYDGIVGLTDDDMTAHITLSEEDIAEIFPDVSERTQDNVGKYITDARGKAINAVSLDDPRAVYYIDELGGLISISFTLKEGGIVKSAEIPLEYSRLSYYESKTVCDLEIASAIADIIPSIDTTSTYSTVKSIHDIVAKTLTYKEWDVKKCRSVYTAFVGWEGSHEVVCEGYAKMFKVLCDEMDIPCIIVSGIAKDKTASEPEDHMWNYVYMEDKDRWYLVDSTWDDQSETLSTYLLAGTDTDGFYIKVGESHSPTTTSAMFSVPSLSKKDYLHDFNTITFDSDGGTYVEPISAVSGSTVSKPTDPTRTGYTFVEWQLNGERYEFTTMPEVNITLKAVWKVNQYTISFDSDGGSSVADMKQDYGTKVTAPASPTKTGHTFKEWQLDGKRYEFTTMPAENITLKAVWEPIKYDVIFRNDGSVYSQSKVAYGEPITLPEKDPTKASTVQYDYTFTGWKGYTFGEKVSGDRTFDAEYDAVIRVYTVDFRSEGETFESNDLAYGSAIERPLTDPVRKSGSSCDYRFVSWNGLTDGMTVKGNHTFDAVFEAVVNDVDTSGSRIAIVTDGVDTVNMNASSVDKIRAAGKDLQVTLSKGKLALDSASAAGLPSGEKIVSITTVDQSKLPSDIVKKIGDRPVYGVSFGGIHEFNGNVDVTLAYSLKSGEKAENVCIWNIRSDGTYDRISCNYESGYVTFTASQLSDCYAVTVEEPQAAEDDNSTLLIACGAGAAIVIIIILALLIIRKKH